MLKAHKLPRSRPKTEEAWFEENGIPQMGRVVLLGTAHGVHDIYSGFLSPLIPEFIEKFAISKAQAGLLVAFMQTPSLVQPFIGYLADQTNLRWMVVLAPAITAIMMSLLGIAPSYAVIALFLFIAGLSSAHLHAIGPAIVSRVSGPALGRGMGFWMVGGTIGLVISPLVVAVALNWSGLAGLPWLMIGGLLASVLLYLLLFDVVVVSPSAQEQKLTPWWTAFGQVKPYVWKLAAITLSYVFVVEALTAFLPTFLREGGATRWSANISLSVYQVAGVAGAFLGGVLGDRFGRKQMLLVAFITLPGLLLLFLASSGWVSVLTIIGLGLIGLTITPNLMALGQETYPDHRAMVNGMYMGINFVGQSLAAFLLGAIGDIFGLRTAFAFAALLPFLALPVILQLPGRREG